MDCVNPSPKLQETYARSYALRMLIHYLGDVHQPLHCLARIDKKFPIGDKGGNLFTLPNHYESADLHAVWDSVLYKFHNSPPLPFTPETWQEYGELAKDLMNRYSNFTFSNSLDVNIWASESHNLGKLAYAGAVENEKLSDTYIQNNMPIIEQQIIKGGVRLAHLLTYIFAETHKNSLASNQTAFLQ